MHELHSSSLFDDPTGLPPQTMSKKGFAEHVRVSPGRISQLITNGLPVEPNGRIHVARGVAWIAENIDQNRRRASLSGPAAPPLSQSARAVRDTADAEISRLKAAKLGGALIDRRATLRWVEGRARGERDAWIGWVNRAAQEISAVTGADMHIVVAALDKSVREQLIALSERRLPEFGNE